MQCNRSSTKVSILYGSKLLLTDKGAKNLVLDLILALQGLPDARRLPSPNGRGSLLGDLSRFISVVDSDEFEIRSVAHLLEDVVNNEPDAKIWKTVQDLVTQSTPPPRALPNFVQTPYSFNTSSFVNTSEYRKHVDGALKVELGAELYIDIEGFYKVFFGEVEGLETVAAAVFMKCQKGIDPLYSEELGWRDWPHDAKEKDVLKWLAGLIEFFLDAAEEVASASKVQRRPLAQPDQALLGSTADRKLDVGFVNDPKANQDSRCHWSKILVPGELKSNSAVDRHSKTWLDLGRYAREVLAAQDTRRFVLGFTLCGSIMRLWEFDRLGGIASPSFDINKDGLQFVCATLGFLWMGEEQLGFDPTIVETDGKRYIDIIRNDKKERLILDKLINRAPCVAGRATTCWKAYREGDELQRPLVIKDSWQYPEREEEGELLREATEKKVVNVARYYHHETVRVGGDDDDVCKNIRKGLMVRSNNYKPRGSITSPNVSGVHGALRKGRSNSIAGRKRSSSCVNAPLPSSKRIYSSSPTKDRGNPAEWDRVHRRVIICDYGQPLYQASSRVAILTALEGCIEGYESLYTKTSMLQSDISIGNLRMNEDDDNPSWRAFIIDLDLAIKEQREESSGARGKTGTRAFMAIGVLYGEKHSFMHDLESFFWVLFWICIHYNRPNEKSRVVEKFEEWNYIDTEKLAELKKGIVSHEGDFKKTIDDNFTLYYQSLRPWMNRLRKVVFPNGGRWEKDDLGLYSRMKDILREAREDQDVALGS